MDINNGYSWILMDINHGYSWLLMDIKGYNGY